ncbi:KIR-like protein [Plasmodium coatneyi]|uniref:KIR-like protein n=1 Tax=Plasmodium coatneyi TaxID=208452 RepID=A0A1B1DU14_9APIC|nr:KIR-like protein [Plasmodium coatneyi]ANQ06075.1 KIR-like protein [Plasmodium coatneyi]
MNGLKNISEPHRSPSEVQFYDKLGAATRVECTSISGSTESLKNTLGGALKNYLGFKGSEDNIANAYCLACQRNEHVYHNGEPCYFFYYWLGDTYWNKARKDDLSGALEAIYTTLGSKVHGKKCNVKYDDVDKDLFLKRKVIFDYYYNYKTERKKFLNNESNCNNDWFNYRETIITACKAVEKDCEAGNSKNSLYCKDFKDKYEAYCEIVQQLQWTCNQISNLKGAVEEEKTTCSSAKDQLQNQITQEKKAASSAAKTAASKAQSNLSEAVSKATTTTALSSIFGTLAMTTVLPFLLYKYKPWSFWFGNHTSGNGGGRRKRRRRSVGRDIDTLTDDSTTYSILDNSTENSTVSSVAYNTRPSTREREGRNNNEGGRGMVGYQNM